MFVNCLDLQASGFAHGSWSTQMARDSWLAFCNVLLVCFNSMALGTNYEPTDAAHLSVKGQEPDSRHSNSSAQFVQISERPRMEVRFVARNLSY